MSFHEIDDDTLLAYADGMLDPAQHAQVAALLEGDPELQAELDALKRVQAGLRSTLDAAHLLPVPDPAARERIVRRSARRRRQRLSSALGVGVCALIVAAFVLLGQGRGAQTSGAIPAPTSVPAVDDRASPVSEPRSMTLAEARQALPFPIFVPTRLPGKLVQYLPKLDGQLLSIDYGGTVIVTNGPTGCCLYADARKSGELVTLPNGNAAHFLRIEEQDGGPILWWQQEGTYIAISGPRLTKDMLVEIAASVSKTAGLNDATPLPPPGPAGPLPAGRIAFAMSHGEVAGDPCSAGIGIYVLNAGADKPTYLTNGCSPILSPDGRRMVFGKGSDLYAINVDGSQEIQLTRTPETDANPAWSPDGRRIAFAENNQNGAPDIYVMNSDGSQKLNLTKSARGLAPDALMVGPYWSPDGRRLAFSAGTDFKPGQEGNWDVYVVNSDGSGLSRLTNDPASENAIGWTPDGRQLIFSSERSGEYKIYKMNVDGSQQTVFYLSDATPIWSPDQQRIAFVNSHDQQLYIMNADGDQRQRLTENLGNVFNPIWSPDGQYIIFGVFSPDWQAGALYAIRADGSDLRRLIAADMWLQWTQR